jgi:hypothetical protein
MPNEQEEVKDTGEEVITPENVEQKLDDETPEEKETPAESSMEKKPDGEKAEDKTEESKPEEGKEETEKPEAEAVDESEEEKKPEITAPAEVEGEVKEPKEVPGETPREKALRLETGRVKALLRKERGKKLLGDVQIETPATELSAEEKKVLEGFDPEQVANQEKLFTVLAKKHGYIRKDEFSKQTYTESAQTILDEFLEQHEEYSADKDPDGVLWKQFKEEYGLYQKPANPRDFKKIFNRIHNGIFGITTTPKQTPGQIAAKQEKVKVASAGGGAAKPGRLSDKRTAPTSANPELSKVARSGGLKGFTEEEIAELGL